MRRWTVSSARLNTPLSANSYLVDLGAVSGALLLSLLAEAAGYEVLQGQRQRRVFGLDEEALEYAKDNADRLLAGHGDSEVNNADNEISVGKAPHRGVAKAAFRIHDFTCFKDLTVLLIDEGRSRNSTFNID